MAKETQVSDTRPAKTYSLGLATVGDASGSLWTSHATVVPDTASAAIAPTPSHRRPRLLGSKHSTTANSAPTLITTCPVIHDCAA